MAIQFQFNILAFIGGVGTILGIISNVIDIKVVSRKLKILITVACFLLALGSQVTITPSLVPPSGSQMASANASLTYDIASVKRPKTIFSVMGWANLEIPLPETTTGLEIKDAYGNAIERRYMDADGKLKNNKEGFAIVRSEYDSNDHEVSRTFYDESNNMVLRSDVGYAEAEYDYSKSGKLIESKFFDTKGLPILRFDGFSERRDTYDTSNRIIKVEYLNTDNKSVENKDGYNSIKYEYNWINKKESKVLYLDANNNMIDTSYGYAQIIYTYNWQNCLIKTEYRNSTGQLSALNGNYAVILYKYDNKKNCIKEMYYNSDNVLFAPDNIGYAIISYDYNEKNRVSKKEFYGTDETLTYPTGKTFASVGYEYDEMDNIIKISTYNKDGSLVLDNDSGCAIIRSEYDENNNKVHVSYYNDNDRPIINPYYGCFALDTKYDDFGRDIEYRFYDTDNQLMLDEKMGGVAIACFEYDKAGNIIKESDFGVNDEPIINSSDWSVRTYQYDNNYKLVDYTYYDTTGNIIKQNQKVVSCIFVSSTSDSVTVSAKGGSQGDFYFGLSRTGDAKDIEKWYPAGTQSSDEAEITYSVNILPDTTYYIFACRVKTEFYNQSAYSKPAIAKTEP